jgi:asparagine synthase (glutamine-hydrolysing)
MCGIAGIAYFDGRPVAPDALQRMADALRHRGPDGEGLYVNGSVGFAHRRLSIIDPAGGRQPFTDAEAGLALTYNGEVYNYKEIRQRLADRGRLRTESDTEVVLASYRERGIDCLTEFRGMFVFALHDRSAQRLYLVRDRLGIKPLYYSMTSDRLVFASELNALLRAGCVDGGIDPSAVASYFRYGYVATPASIYSAVKKLPPATYLIVDLDSGRTSLERYWSLSASPLRYADEEEALDRLNGMLTETVRLYLRSDVPFGSFLSGGVDSSVVSAVMAQELTEPVHTFTIGFREAPHSELPYARSAAERLRSDHSETVVSAEMLQDILPVLARQFGEPFGDSSAIPTYYVSQAAAAKVRMVLSGDGGDELFAGYDSYLMALLRMDDRRESGVGFGRTLRVLWGRCVMNRENAPRDPLQDLHDSQREVFRPDSLSTLLGEDIAMPQPEREAWDGATDPITRFQYQDLRTYLPDDVLTKVDRMSMANSLEVRVPLLDHKLVEFAFALPLSMKLSRYKESVRTKHLLKRSAERFFPRSLLDRPKMGFGIPVIQWLVHDLADFVQDHLMERNHLLFDHGSRTEIHRLVREFYGGRQEHVAKIWFLLMFKLWGDGVGHNAAVRSS